MFLIPQTEDAEKASFQATDDTISKKSTDSEKEDKQVAQGGNASETDAADSQGDTAKSSPQINHIDEKAGTSEQPASPQKEVVHGERMRAESSPKTLRELSEEISHVIEETQTPLNGHSEDVDEGVDMRGELLISDLVLAFIWVFFVVQFVLSGLVRIYSC